MNNVISVDIGGSKIVVAVVSEDGKIIEKEKISLPPKYEQNFLVEKILKACFPLKKYNPVACGVAIPGLCDIDSGIWKFAPFSGVRDFEISKTLSKAINLPVFIDNDVNLCALGEKQFGICKDQSDFLWVTVSNGVGGALYLNDKLFKGQSGNAGEIGHFYVGDDSYVCGCGKKGCLETFSSGQAIQKEYFKRTNKDLTACQIAERVKEDDIAKAVFERAGYSLGKSLSYVVNLLNVRKIVLGGGVMQSFDLILPSIQKGLKEHVFTQANENVDVEYTGLGYYATVIGAGALAHERYNQIYLGDKNMTTNQITKMFNDYAMDVIEGIKKTDFIALSEIAEKIVSVKDTNSTIYTIGNGGSASTASHICNDLLKGCGVMGHTGFKTECLCDSTAVMSCLANDFDYNSIFTVQLRAKAQKGDILIAYSGSGNSQNVISGITLAKEMGLTVIGFTGRDGGKMAKLCDIVVIAPNDCMEKIEDFHMLYNHSLTYTIAKILTEKYKEVK